MMHYGKNYMINQIPDEWDIWYAAVPFEDTNEIKKRPVLILDTQDILTVVAMKLTSKPPRLNEYSLTDLVAAGLLTPTTARIGKIAKLSRNNLIKKFGSLCEKDKNAIIQFLIEINACP